MTLTITHFPGGYLAPQGRRIEVSWDALAKLLTTPRPYQGDKQHSGWSPATFNDDYRKRDNVESVCMMGLDFDDGMTLEEAAGTWHGVAAIQHTTKSHTPAAPRFRHLMLLSRAVTPNEYDGLWARLQFVHQKADENAKDASRFWYTPGVKPGGEFIGRVIEGDPLDVDYWLNKPDPRPKPEPEIVVDDSADHGDAYERARAYLATYPSAISGQDGSRTTLWAAIVLVRGFLLSDADALRLLATYNERCKPKWSERELEHKIKSAKNATRIKHADGWLLYAEKKSA